MSEENDFKYNLKSDIALSQIIKDVKNELISDFLQELESINAFITIIKTKLEEKLK